LPNRHDEVDDVLSDLRLRLDTVRRLRTDNMTLAMTALVGGRVLNSNATTFTCDIVGDHGEVIPDVPLASPYLSAERGQGFTAIPEPNSRCLMAVLSTGEQIILAFLPPIGIENVEGRGSSSKGQNPSLKSYQGRSANRLKDRAVPLVVGDQEIRGRNGNCMTVRRSGALELVSVEGQLFTRYVNRDGEHAIISVAEVVETTLKAGKFVWQSEDETGLGSLDFQLKSDIKDEQPDIRIRMGGFPDDDVDAENKVSVSVTTGGQEVKLIITKEGEVQLEAKTLTITARENIQVNCETANVEANGSVRITGSPIDLN
jgi:hypothetical protein